MKYSELISRIPVCDHAPEDPLSPDLLKMLTDLEAELGIELEYTSGYRCPECNAEAKGSKNSAHLRGHAVDIRCGSSALRFSLLSSALLLGVKRMGVGKTFIHLDVDKSLPQKVVWTYD